MIRCKKIISFVILCLISLALITDNVYALSTGYKPINEDYLSINDGQNNIELSQVSFYKHKSDRSSFGFTGIVYNKNSYNVSLSTTVNYYDKNNVLVAKTNSMQLALAGKKARIIILHI